MCAQLLHCIQLFATPWTIAHQAPLSMGFSRQKYWSRLPFPLQGIFSTWGLNPHLLHWQVDSFTTEPPGEPLWIYMWLYFVTPCSGIRELSCNHFILEDSHCLELRCSVGPCLRFIFMTMVNICQHPL